MREIVTSDGVTIRYRSEPASRVEPAETSSTSDEVSAGSTRGVGSTGAAGSTRGVGPAHAVLLVHGFATNADLTWDTTGWFRALADAGFDAIAPDLRGHGASGKPHEASAYSPGILAADLVAVLDDAGTERVDVVAYSMGSYVALALAAIAPERVHRLVLGGIGGGEQFSRWGVDSVRAALLHDTPPEDPVAAGLISAVLKAPGVDREALAACVAGMAASPVEVAPAATVAPSTPTAPSMPTMLAVGEADSVAEGADRLAERLDATLVTIPKRNHLTTLSARSFKQTALGFLAEA